MHTNSTNASKTKTTETKKILKGEEEIIMADKIKFSLHDLKSVNTVLGMLYDANGNYRPGFKPEEFYNTILLDTLKYGEENFVHLKYAETINIRKGEKVARFRRWAGMTPTIRPMIEGLPPAPDKHAYEYMEVGNVFSFGRWSEYTDQIDMSHISEIVAERSVQYGENANQTKELYARKTWLSSPNDYFANFKEGFDELCFGDSITIDDLRFLTARMKRMQVKPLSGKFNYICSPEFINGLIDDPRVKMYMEINQTTGNLWTSGECFPLFDLNFIPTMLDEFAYPDVEFPGVYEKADGHEVIRLYAYTTKGTSKYIIYMDVLDDYEVKSGIKARKVAEGVSYLSDGTAVENLVQWEFPTDATSLNGRINDTLSTSAVKVKKSLITTSAPDKYGIAHTVYGDPVALDTTSTGHTAMTYEDIDTLVDEGKFMQLPVHRGILFGDEAMIKLNYEGLSDAPRIIIKALGSSGVLDPLDQRQSVGYRVDGFGLAIKRPEAICVTYGIPANAEFAALTAAYVMGGNAEYKSGVLDYVGEWTTDSAGNKAQAMVIDAVNNPYEQSIATALVDAYSKYKPLVSGKDYPVDSLVQWKGVPYRVKTAIDAIPELTAGTAVTANTYFASFGTVYKALKNFTPSDVDALTGNILVEEEDAQLVGSLFDYVKAKLAKDADNLFKNISTDPQYGTANDPKSNIK